MIVYDNIFQESKIDAKKRDSLKDSDFGIPDKREYPLTDEEHVRKAVQMFSYADESDRHELAERIVLKAKKFGMNWENWLGIRRYLSDSYKQHIQESVRVESSTSEQPFYFYHLLPKTVKFDEYGLKTPDYVYTKEHDEELYLKMTNKYRNRLCNEWGIYPDKNPDDLTAAEIYAGINEFRQDIRGNNQIYLFRYPPTESLGHNMKDILKDKCIVRVDINDPKTKKYIHDIFWGHEGSFTGNKKLSREWYENISKGEYFKDYDDDSKMIFASLNHISLDPEYGYLPIDVLNISESATDGEPDFEGVVKYKNEKEGNNMQNDFYDLPEDPINIMEMDINDDIDSKTDDLPSKDQDSDDDSKTDDDSDKKITGKDDEDKDDEDEDEDKDDDNETDDDDDEEDAEDEDDKDEENDGDDLESFGSDTDGSTPDNEYDEDEIKILNDLIADEEQAMSGYYHGALNSKIDILTRLYANIGDEERFHAEQLMYAKSTITGEKYSPQDPKVKSEYEDLLKMGMDEETAMSTAIDKRNMVDDDDEDDSDMEDIEDDVSVIESAIYQNELLMAICEYKISTVEDCDAAFGLFIESYIYMEEMDNVSSALGKSQRAANPLKLLMKGVNALIKMLMQLSRKTRDYINKSKIRRKRKFDWIKKHGIKELFAGGVSLYFYSEKTASFDVEEAIRYVDLLYRITKMVAANTGMRLKEPAKYKTIRNPIPFKTTDAAINILHGIVLTKTKVILTDNSEAAILEELFGYKENKLRVGTSRGEDEPIIHESGNFYNRMEALISLTTEYANVANAVVDMLSRFEGDTNSIYYKNRSLYNNATRVMQEVGKSYNTILGAMTHDLNTVMKLDNGILEMSRNRDRIEQTGGQWTGPTSNPSVQAKTNSNKYVERK